VVLGADRPAGHQQRLLVRPGDRVRVDNAQVYPRHPGTIRLRARRVNRDRDLGRHIGPQPARLVQHGDRPDLAGWVWQVAVQPHP
jgi:hypothetical protein